MSDVVTEQYAGEDLSLLRNLTLIIPTYNRNFYLSRCLWYHAHFPFGKIIVADSSQEEKKVVNRETVAKIREMFGVNVQLLQYEPETEKYGGDIYRKWGDAVQHVETEFSMICGDREFLIPTTLRCCVAYLAKHQDYVVVEGEDYFIESYAENEIEFYPWQGVASFDGDTAEERLDEYLKYERVAGTQFGVMRAACQKQIYTNLEKYHILDIRFGETAIELQPLLFGKTKRFPNLPQNCRDCIHAQEYSVLVTKVQKSESSFTRYPYLVDYPQERYQEMTRNTAECFINVLYDTSYIDDNYLMNKEEMLKRYIIPLIEKRYLPAHTLLKESAMLREIWFRMPQWAKDILSKTIGTGKGVRGSPKNPNKDMKCVLQIIADTNHCHIQDKVIISEQSPKLS